MNTDRRAVASCLAVVAGIAAGDRLPPGPGRPLVLGGILSCGLGVVLARGRARTALGLGAVALLAAAATVRAADGLVTSRLAPAARDGRSVRLAAVLVSDPDPVPHGVRAVVSTGGGRLLAVARDGAGSVLAVAETGDRLALEGRLRPLAGSARRWRWRHVVAELRVDDVPDVHRSSSPLLTTANGVRHLVLHGGDGLGASDRGLLSGFLLGDTRGVPDRLEAQFRAAGLSHLLAVSGANVAFVLALLSPVQRRLASGGRLVAGLLVLAVFGAMTRWEPSVLRAATMAALALVASSVGRPASAVRIFALSVAALLLADPFLLHSVGFQLSCAASAGIVVLAPRLRARLPGPAWFRDTLSATVAAQLGVTPVLLAVFGGLPLVALGANLLAVPVAGPLTVWGVVAGAAAGALTGALPELATLLQVPTLAMLRYVAGVAVVCARAPYAAGPGALALASSAGVVLALARRRSAPR